MSVLSDPHRLRALEAAALLDTPAEAMFDRLTNLAARTLGVPVALVSLVTPDRQFFKAQCGLPPPAAERRETPLSHSFCQYVVEDGEALIVEDARSDERLADNLAISDLGVIAYAGLPDPQRRRRGARLLLRDRRPPARVVERRPRDHRRAGRVRDRRDRAALGGRRRQRRGPPAPARARARAARAAGRAASAIYRPGEQRSLLGGDFYLCEPLPDGTVALMIGDVAGHGPEAAAFAMSLRSAWRALLLAPLGLEERADRLNQIALGQQPARRVRDRAG